MNWILRKRPLVSKKMRSWPPLNKRGSFNSHAAHNPNLVPTIDQKDRASTFARKHINNHGLTTRHQKTTRELSRACLSCALVECPN